MTKPVHPLEPRTNAQAAAQDRTRMLLVIGVIGAIAGGLMIGAFWPDVDITAAVTCEPTDFYCTPVEGDVEETGSEWGVLLGVLVAGLSQIALLIAIISHGVALGVARAGHQAPLAKK